MPDGFVMEPGEEIEIAGPLARHNILVGNAALVGGQGVRVRFVNATSLGGGDDVAVGEELVLEVDRARALLNQGSVVLAPLTDQEREAIFGKAHV